MLNENDFIDLIMNHSLVKNNVKFELNLFKDPTEGSYKYNFIVNSSSIEDFDFYVDLIKIDIEYFDIAIAPTSIIEYADDLSENDRLFIDNIQIALGHHFLDAFNRIKSMEIYK